MACQNPGDGQPSRGDWWRYGGVFCSWPSISSHSASPVVCQVTGQMRVYASHTPCISCAVLSLGLPFPHGSTAHQAEIRMYPPDPVLSLHIDFCSQVSDVTVKPAPVVDCASVAFCWSEVCLPCANSLDVSKACSTTVDGSEVNCQRYI